MGNRHGQHESTLRQRASLNAAAEQFGALAQAREAKVASDARYELRWQLGHCTAAIVAHAHLHGHVVAGHQDISLLRLSVLTHIREPFLYGPVDRAGHGWVYVREIAAAPQGDVHRS